MRAAFAVPFVLFCILPSERCECQKATSLEGPGSSFAISKAAGDSVAEGESSSRVDGRVTGTTKPNHEAKHSANTDLDAQALLMTQRYGAQQPQHWGPKARGVKRRLRTDERVLALTFDACGGEYDEELVEVLRREEIPAAFFVSGKWLRRHKEIVKELAEDPLFRIENHGLEHRPLSVNGASVFDLPGTRNIAEIVEEVESNALSIEAVTGRRPKCFRAAGAFCDEVAAKVALDLGQTIVSYSVNGDAGGTLQKQRILDGLLEAPSGSIVIFHVNRPAMPIAEAISEAIPVLKNAGVQFVHLSDHELSE